MSKRQENAFKAVLLDDELELSVEEICRVCRLSAEQLQDYVEEGIVEPLGEDPVQWRFQSISVRRVSRASRLQRDFGLNSAGVGLALELLDEIRQLRRRLQLPR